MIRLESKKQSFVFMSGGETSNLQFWPFSYPGNRVSP